VTPDRVSLATNRSLRLVARWFAADGLAASLAAASNVSISRGGFGALRKSNTVVYNGSVAVDAAIAERDIMPRTHQLGGDWHPHVAKTDEADSHFAFSCH
jgi:hypothetical protein